MCLNINAIRWIISLSYLKLQQLFVNNRFCSRHWFCHSQNLIYNHIPVSLLQSFNTVPPVILIAWEVKMTDWKYLSPMLFWNIQGRVGGLVGNANFSFWFCHCYRISELFLPDPVAFTSWMETGESHTQDASMWCQGMFVSNAGQCWMSPWTVQFQVKDLCLDCFQSSSVVFFCLGYDQSISQLPSEYNYCTCSSSTRGRSWES